jgi:hypothetical protein
MRGLLGAQARPQQAMTAGVSEAMFRFLWDLLFFLTGEGSWALRPHERIVLEAAIANLPDHAQKLMRPLLKQTVFVQRSHVQVSYPRFYSTFYVQNRSAIEDEFFVQNVLSVQIDVDEERQSAQVEFFKGRISSIQFKKPAKFYAGKEVKAMSVKPIKPNLSHAAAIDRLEHGKEH